MLTRLARPTQLLSEGALFDIDFADAANGWIAGPGTDGSPSLLGTHDLSEAKRRIRLLADAFDADGTRITANLDF